MSPTATEKPTETTTTATTAPAPTTASGEKTSVISVFVGDLDPTVGEDQLLDTFKNSGPIISVRVCRDIITRKSLGYGYINFQNHSDAEKAIENLNFSTIGGRRVRLMWQQRDPALRISGRGNLFVRNLDASTDHTKLIDIFSNYGSILSAKVMTDGEGKCRGYGFVHFKDEKNADKALDEMNGKTLEGWSNPLYVASFLRRNARIALLVQNFTNVYIKHLLPQATISDIEKFFSKFGGISSAITKHDTKGRTFAFCNFKKHEDAVKAIESLNEKDIDGLTTEGEALYVARAQHRAERLIELRQKYLQRQSRGNNLYVRNFDPNFTDENLRELFSGFGDIKSCRIMADEKGNPRGFGFVSFNTAEEANLALREMNGRMLNGKPLVVNVAQRRDHRMSMLQVQFHQRLQNMIASSPMMGGGNMFQSSHKGFLGQQQQAAAAAAAQQQQQGGAAASSSPAGPSSAVTANPMMMSMQQQMMMMQQMMMGYGGGMMMGGRGGRGGRGRGGRGGRGGNNVNNRRGRSNNNNNRRTMSNKNNNNAAGNNNNNTNNTNNRRGRSNNARNKNNNKNANNNNNANTVTANQQNINNTIEQQAQQLPPLTLDDLMVMSVDERKRTLGERLFPAVLAADVPEELTPKITGMLLELDPSDGLALLGDGKKLKEKIDEALCVLKSSSMA